MKYYAVIDTNVIVSALFKSESNPGLVLKMILNRKIIPIVDHRILTEYEEVLSRDKFKFDGYTIKRTMEMMKNTGIFLKAETLKLDLPDPDDVKFFEVVMEKRKTGDAYLVTGNTKHFPKEPFIVTPKELLDIIAEENHE